MFSFTEMTNHGHQFLQTPEPNLSDGMQFLLSDFAARVNRRHGLRGALFQGRYKAELIEDETYFWAVSRYVHLNPMRTKPPMVDRLEDWPWSSYPGYVDPRKRLDWIDYDAIYGAWSGTFGGDPASAYRAYVEQGIADPPPNPFLNAIDGWILGSQEFVEWLRERVDLTQSPADMPNLRRFLTVSLPDLLARVSQYYSIPAAQVLHRRTRHISRAVVAWLSRRYTRSTRKQLARFLNLRHPESVTNLIRKVDRLRVSDIALQHDLDRLEAGLVLVSSRTRVGEIDR
jgi:hypothetical protein